MQFLPFAQSTVSKSAPLNAAGAAGFFAGLGTMGAMGSGSAKQYLAGKKNDFLAALNRQLSEIGVAPLDVTAGQGAPKHFRRLEQSDTALNEGDIKALRDALRERGVREKDLTALDGLMESGSVPNMGALMSSLMGFRRASEQLDETEREASSMFLRKLGFDQESIDSMQAVMERGGGRQALTEIKKRIEGLADNDAVPMRRDEFAAMLRGLDITGKGRDMSLAAFGGGEDRTLSKKELSGLLDRAGAELDKRESAKMAIAQELRGALDEVLRTKAGREKDAPQADARGSRKAERAETLMKNDLSATAMDIAPETGAAARGKGSERGDRDGREEHSGRDAGTKAESARSQPAPAASAIQTDQPGLPDQQARFDPASLTERQDGTDGDTPEHGQQQSRNFAEERREAARNPSDALPTPRSEELRGVINSAFASVDVEGPLSGTANTAPRQSAPLPRSSQSEIFAQVQKGVLSELSNGSHQLTLRLDPAELGQVTVQLTVHKGEVKALFRVESAEVSSALSEQMSQLKASLEEQGLKVTQLEVQTQLMDDTTNREWSGMDYYNKEQEMREQARFQRLAKMRQEAAQEGSGALAQDMQNESIREEFSPSGLHIVA